MWRRLETADKASTPKTRPSKAVRAGPDDQVQDSILTRSLD